MWRPLPDLPGAESFNQGIGQQTTEQVRLRLGRDALAFAPRVVVLEVGVNDLKSIGALPGEEAAILGRCRENLGAIVRDLRESGARVVLLTIFPVGPPDAMKWPFWSAGTVDAIDAANESIKALAGPGVTVVDCDRFLRRGRLIAPEFAADTLHLGPRGYAALSGAVRPVLREVLDGPPGPGVIADDAVQ
jgi:lysophospholipase L1-like esterase